MAEVKVKKMLSMDDPKPEQTEQWNNLLNTSELKKKT